MNLKYKAWLCFIGLILFIPIGIYTITLHAPLSKSNSDWGAFGSYIGGVYGPIFTFISVLVLIYTLKEMQKNNRNQTEQNMKEKTLSDIRMLCELLEKRLTRNNFIKPTRKYFYNWYFNNLKSSMKDSPPLDEEELWKRAISFIGKSPEIYEQEIPLLGEILYRISQIQDDDLYLTATLVVRGFISNEERFWMECYLRKFDSPTAKWLNKWPNFSSPPKKLIDMIPDTPDNPTIEGT
ncbi:TPA: hypothetical protein ACGFAK_004227 [Serratia marcescens]|uniref:hypothetical protein n=1 Tax=Serratia marcescens TaxID=615 RepID=UPI0036F738F8